MSDLHDFDKKKIATNFGIDVDVDRDSVRGEPQLRANRALGDIGQFIKCDCDLPQLKEAEYMGSAALHIYFLPGMREHVYVCQADPLGKVPEYFADEAFKQLRNEMMNFYGRQRKTRRSGA